MSQREAFEAHMNKISPLADLSVDRSGAYVNGRYEFGYLIWQAAIAHAVPEGYVVVPVRPTYKMKKAAKAYQGCSDRVKYEAMIAAAPESQGEKK